MKYQKYIIPIWFLFAVPIVGYLLWSPTSGEKWVPFLTFEAKNGFEIFFDPLAKKELKEYYQSGTVVINGSYFGTTTSGSYYPAGRWNIVWQKYFQDDIAREDPNLSHIALYDHAGGVILFLPNNETLPDCADRKINSGSFDCSTFQAWPLVLTWWHILDILDSWHADEPHERTLIGTTEEGKIYFFIFTEKVSLKVAWESIKLRFPNDNMSVLNLDGGPSTAYYDGENGFWQNKKLPIILRIN